MSEQITIDSNKLAEGLKEGIRHTDLIFARLPYQHLLRGTPCGLVASAIHTYAEQHGIPSRLYITKPALPFDKGMRHVFPVIGESEDPTVVDASYSQFLSYVGLHMGYELHTNTTYFPDEEIMSFKLSQRGATMRWLGAVANNFQTINSHPEDEYGEDVGSGPLVDASAEQIQDYYSRIWQPTIWQPWIDQPSYAITDGETVAACIPEGCILSE